MKAPRIEATAVVALAMSLSACASDAMGRRWDATLSMGPSRAAAVLRYDDKYLKDLEKWINRLREEQKDPALRDDVGLLFALDELAEIHTFRSVNFERARVASGEAAELLQRVRQEAQGRIGWYFNHNRRLYAFLMGPFKWHLELPIGAVDDEIGIESGLRWTGRAGEPVKSVYPPSVVRALVGADLELLAGRVAAREEFLDEVTGSKRARAVPAPSPEGREASVAELEIWSEALQQIGEPARGWVLLERAWRLHDQMGREAWAAKVIETGRPLLAIPTSHEDGLVIGIGARLRVGYAQLLAGDAQTGVKLIEEALGLIQVFDRGLDRRYQAARSGMHKQAGLWAGLGVLKALTGPVGWPEAALYLVSAPTGIALQERMIRAQYGEGGHGLEMFFTEAERVEFHYRLGRAYEDGGRPERAIEQYKTTIDLNERRRATIRTELGRIRYVGRNEAPYAGLVALLVKAGNFTSAVEYAERARARALVDLLADGRVTWSTTEDRNRYEEVVRRQTELQVLIDQGLPRSVAGEIRSAAAGDQVVKAVGAEQPSLEFASLTSVGIASLEKVSLALGDAALVSFVVGDDETSVLLLQDGVVNGWVRPIGRQALISLVGDLRRALQAPAIAPSQRSGSDGIQALGGALYRDLLAPAFEMVKKRIVYIAPHGPLHYVPFAAIHDGREYLVDRYTLVTIPSGTVLTYLEKKRGAADGPTVVLANPDLGDNRLDLPYAEREGTVIRRQRPDTILLTRTSATKKQARALAAKAGVLHFAAHASLNLDQPLESAVLLTPGEEQNGQLTAGEIFGLKLPPSLVVLSACETGLGPLASGDELIGLTRAFMFAGAPHVVATLWQIADESTALLMEEFYTQLRSQPVADALRLAQMNIRRRYPHPYHWAAFTVFGHYRPVRP